MSKLKVDTIANSADSASTPIADVINGSARAWVNFNGTGTVAIRAAYNVSSITDNAAGDYTVNFTNAMPDTSYTTQITTNRASVNTTLATSCRIADELTAYNVNNVRMRMGVPDSNRVLTSEDFSFVCVSIFR
jgi:hypothetical protein